MNRRTDPMVGWAIPTSGGGQHIATLGEHLYVDPVNGNDGANGARSHTPFRTLAFAVARAEANGLISCAQGQYDETVVIARDLSGLVIQGLGGRGAAYIEPDTAGAEGLDVRADDVTLLNFGVAGAAAADFALRVYGARFRAFQSKFEGPDGTAVILGPGTVAQHTAGSHGTAGDALFDDCEFTWCGRGLDLTSSDYGAVTQCRLRNKCYFHNIVTAHIRSNDVAGSNVCVRDILAEECIFGKGEDGNAPTDFLLLNVTGDNGLVRDCDFATTVFAAATITLAAGVLFVGNRAEQEGALATGGTAGRPD